VRITLRLSVLCVIGLLVLPAAAFAQTGFLKIVDHIHLAVPNQPQAVEWYQKHFGGQPMTEGPDRLMLEQTRLIFQKNDAPLPSAGSVLDHIGFSMADLDATVKQLAAEGLHHVHLRAADPAAALAWYVDAFGGTAGKLKGQLDGVAYGDVWILAQRGDAAPSAGHAIDHIGFRPIRLDEAVARLKSKNVKVTSEPRPLTLPSGTSMRIAFIEGPDAVRIELVQR